MIKTMRYFGLDDFLHPVARATDGEPLVVEQVTDAPNHQHLMMLVIAAVAAPLHRLELAELLLPVAQDVGLDAAKLAHFTDREVAFCRNVRKRFLHKNQ